jgi:hypothetical protein
MDSVNEYETIGMIALIGLVVLPGVLWISKAKGAGGVILRSAVVGTLLLGAVTVEASMDQAANSF